MAPTEVLADAALPGDSDLSISRSCTRRRSGCPDATLGMDSLFDETPDEPTVRLALLTGSQAMTNFDSGAGRPRSSTGLVADGDIDIMSAPMR